MLIYYVKKTEEVYFNINVVNVITTYIRLHFEELFYYLYLSIYSNLL